MILVCLNRSADSRHGWGELEERRRSIGRVPVDWVTVGDTLGS